MTESMAVTINIGVICVVLIINLTVALNCHVNNCMWLLLQILDL